MTAENILRKKALTLPLSQFFSARFIREAVPDMKGSRPATKIAKTIYEAYVKRAPQMTVGQLLSELASPQDIDVFLANIGSDETHARKDFKKLCLKFGIDDFWVIDPARMMEPNYPLSPAALEVLGKDAEEV